MTAPAPAHLARILMHRNGLFDGVVFCPDGRLLATADDDGAARLWDPATSEHRHTLATAQETVC